MAKKLDMHIWSTVPSISDNTKQLQEKINELIDEIDILKSALENNVSTKHEQQCNIGAVSNRALLIDAFRKGYEIRVCEDLETVLSGKQISATYSGDKLDKLSKDYATKHGC